MPLRQRSDAAFTLVELLVAMVILGIVLAVSVRGLLVGFGSTAVTMTTRKAEAVVAQATDQLGDDLRSARAQDRNFDKIREPLQLRKAIMSGETIKDPIPVSFGGCGCPLDVADVKWADQTRFSFLSNMVVEPVGTLPVSECVTYILETGGGGWWIARYVSAGAARPAAAPTCAPAGQKSLVVPRQNSTLVPAPAQVFSYSLVCNRNGVGVRTCNGALGPGTGCQSWTANSASGTALNWIVAVTFDLTALVDRVENLARSPLRGTIGLRTRQNHDYLYAVGCDI